ncbi:MAG: hypothetical protein IKU10_04735, partial [Clostridia bacterium]|nr:hypothetical protein [Clostridia bacterium]
MEKELQAIDFSFLYHSHRNLFHIGYDLEHNQLSTSFYDMLMSEARMTSYYAIAKRQVPPKHWQTLNRTLTRCNGYVGAMSWTGTAFEYLMPSLIMPLYQNTLAHESVLLCIACQKDFAPRALPWGCSESAYYAFDDQLNYQYKAHGVNLIALKYYSNNEYVVSPYSSFLSLPHSTKSALKNLNQLRTLKAYGKYGFYEAIDFTPQRCKNSKQELVHSYMAHHIGMSLCAITNLLQDNILQKLFMQNEIAGPGSLLMEKIPDGASVYNHYTNKSVPAKPPRSIIKNKKWIKSDVRASYYTILSNSHQTLQISSNGDVKSTWQDLAVYGCPSDYLEQNQGVMMFWETHDSITPLTYAPFYRNSDQYQFRNTKNAVQYSVSIDQISIETELSLRENLPVEQRTIKITNKSNQTINGTLLVYFEPKLYTEQQIEAHSAFYKLFIESKYDSQNNRLIFNKRIREKEHGA